VSAPPALEMIDISKQFGGVMALAGARISVRRGTVHGLLGENGAGKTTLMGIAYGMIKPDHGSTRIDGVEVTLRTPLDAIAAGIGMVQQHPANVPVMSVAQNIELGGRGPYKPVLAARRAQALAEKVGFSIDVDSPVGSLSVGDQQRVEIMKAIGRDARVLILDEPTAVLAPSAARDLFLWLRAFAADGGTAIVITHKLDEARSFTDDLTVLRGGSTVSVTSAESSTIASLAASMIGTAAEPDTFVQPNRPAAAEVVVRADSLRLDGDSDIPAVRAASFEIRRGEIIGIAGVDGSGHHHLLLALAGRIAPASGDLIRPERVGFVPEDRHRDAVVLEFTLVQNVALHGAGQRRGWMDWRAFEKRTTAMLDRFDVRARGARQPMVGLSGGNQQKLVLARELDGNPELLVLENPTRGLDIRAALFVKQQVRAARDRGIPIVFYSSDLDEVIDIADRVLVVHAGSVSDVARDRRIVGAAMLGIA